MQPLIVFGHRGAAGHMPENTLASVRKALQLGTKWIEVDVYNVQNQLMVIHDDTLERTTSGSGYVVAQTVDYLRSLDAGNNEKIPFLSEVIEEIHQQAVLNIELKGSNTAELVAKMVHYYLQQGWHYSDFLVSSFNHKELQKIQFIDAQIPIGVLFYGIPANFEHYIDNFNAYSVHFSLDFIDSEVITAAHHRQLKVFFYTVNTPEQLNILKPYSPDGIFSDFPDRFL
jgi:glycerophosphoryl diester phosphodiesterase